MKITPTRILLAIITLLLIAGFTWSLIELARHIKKSKIVANTPTNQITNKQSAKPITTPSTTLPSSSSSTPPSISSSTPNNNVSSAPKTSSQPTSREVVTVITTTIPNSDNSSSASASAGVNPDGSTYAYSSAN